MRSLRTLFYLIVLGVAVYVGAQVLPPYFANYQFQDAMETQARMATVNEKLSEMDIRQSLLKEARSLKIPVAEEQISIRREGQGVVIWADYNVHVDLPIYPLDLEFHPASKNKKM